MTTGEAGIAAPIRGYGGLVVGAIGVSGLVERICDSQGTAEPDAGRLRPGRGPRRLPRSRRQPAAEQPAEHGKDSAP